MKIVPIIQGLRVRVYRNLHNGLYSVQHKGRVIAHVAELTLLAVTFTVQPAGRAKVLTTRKKQVHAFVNGIVAEQVQPLAERVSYNPYRAGHFTTTTGEAIREAPIATLSGNAVFV